MKVKKYNLLFSCLLTSVFCLLISTTQAAYQFTPLCQEAMQKILDLKFKDARLLIESERKAHPDNGYVIFLEHYSEAIELIITEEPSLYKQFIDHLDSRLNEMDALDEGAADFNWLKAEMLFHAGLAQIKFGTRISGVAKIFNSYRIIRDHRKEYPDFWQNQKLTGIYNIIFDNIPGFMRWAADMFGLSGNSDLGIYQLKQYCEVSGKTPGLAEEAILVTGLAYKLIRQEKEGLHFIQQQNSGILQNTLVKYLYAITATYNYQNDLALKLLGEIHQQDLQAPFYSLDYLTGRCKLNHLEPDADIYLKRYLETYPGLDYKKDICNRLSYFYLLRWDMEGYRHYQTMIDSVGQDLRERDQEAILERQSGIIPHTGLLKARLLFDGGYFEEALKEMDKVDNTSLEKKSYWLEYYYRLGRINQLLGRMEQAIGFLTLSYNSGKSQPYTFATRSAFSLGKIYEEKQDYRNAALWYERCVDVFSETHTTEGVKDAAEKGIKRAKAQF